MVTDPTPTPPLAEGELAQRWARTLGPGADWQRVDPAVTQRPADDAGTLSGLATLGHTLSGGATLGGTLSGGATVSSPGAASGAGPGGMSVAKAGEYQLIGELGRGGMGVVYRARQRSLAREIALKFIRPEAANAGARERFVSEALVNGLLDHPNIVPVHELGENERGEFYLAMKLVGGRSWKALLHPRSEEERLAAREWTRERHIGVLQAVGNAIAFAHSRGIVHRDLKPENVMVGEFGEVLVMDWGIAVDIRDAPDGEQRAQHKSTVTAPSGTPSYMAPELAEGRGKDIGPWTDVYLLGAILHEVLTGSPPHLGATLMAVLLAASRSEPRAYAADVPAPLQAIVRRAMAREPRARFQSVGALQEALREYLRNRESMLISDRADAELSALAAEAVPAAAPARGAAGDRTDLYARHAKVVARYDQAIELWEGNQPALSGGRLARLAYARAALSAGDLGLAEAQAAALPQEDAEAMAVRADLARIRAARLRSRKVARRMRWGVIATTALFIVGLIAAVFVLNAQQLRNTRILGYEANIDAAAKERAARLAAAVSAASALGAPRRDLDLLDPLAPRAPSMFTGDIVGVGDIARQLHAEGAVVGCSRDGARLLSLDPGGSALKTWDAIAGAWLATCPLSGMPSITLALMSADGRRVVAIAGAQAQAWDADGAHPLGTWTGDGAIGAAALDPTGTRLAFCRGDELTIAEVASGSVLAHADAGPTDELAWDGGGTLVLVAGRDGDERVVRSLDAATGRLVRRIHLTRTAP